jgi:hypothetical protein
MKAHRDTFLSVRQPGKPLVTTISLKDTCSTAALVQALKQWASGDFSGLIRARDVVAQETSVAEVTWELALKLRLHCR